MWRLSAPSVLRESGGQGGGRRGEKVRRLAASRDKASVVSLNGAGTAPHYDTADSQRHPHRATLTSPPPPSTRRLGGRRTERKHNPPSVMFVLLSVTFSPTSLCDYIHRIGGINPSRGDAPGFTFCPINWIRSRFCSLICFQAIKHFNSCSHLPGSENTVQDAARVKMSLGAGAPGKQSE